MKYLWIISFVLNMSVVILNADDGTISILANIIFASMSACGYEYNRSKK